MMLMKAEFVVADIADKRIISPVISVAPVTYVALYSVGAYVVCRTSF